jgi:hypothetical protein
MAYTDGEHDPPCMNAFVSVEPQQKAPVHPRNRNDLPRIQIRNESALKIKRIVSES